MSIPVTRAIAVKAVKTFDEYLDAGITNYYEVSFTLPVCVNEQIHNFTS